MIKRSFDVVLSLAVILVAVPLWVVVACAIKIDSRGSVLYGSPRVGKGGQPFTLYKFRTMVAESSKKGPRVTRYGDPRVTRVGQFLRRLKTDEMPQLVNVIKGEMSLVGPRPEDPLYVTHYSLKQKQVLTVRPGMASPAFLKYRHEEEMLAKVNGDLDQIYIEVFMPEKLRMDLEYIEHQSFVYDLYILLRAALLLFRLDHGSLIQPES